MKDILIFIMIIIGIILVFSIGPIIKSIKTVNKLKIANFKVLRYWKDKNKFYLRLHLEMTIKGKEYNYCYTYSLHYLLYGEYVFYNENPKDLFKFSELTDIEKSDLIYKRLSKDILSIEKSMIAKIEKEEANKIWEEME